MVGDAVAELLERSGFADAALARQAGELAGRFSEALQHDMFLEFELGEEAVVAGFGLGFSAGTLDELRAIRPAFLNTALGRSLEDALADDPFAADHREHLNLFSDPDPDWVEYDVSADRIDATPFVFFRVPTRFRRLQTPETVREFVRILPGNASSGNFGSLMDAMVAIGAVCPYRIGAARSRGPGWWRAVVTHLKRDQIVAALRSLGADEHDPLLGLASRFYEVAMDKPGAEFALSVDIRNDRVAAVDVECPFLFRIADPEARRQPVGDYLSGITASGIMSSKAADWIKRNVARDVTTSDGGSCLKIMLHHLKFRLFGEPRLRAKAYLLLSLEPASVACRAA